MFEVFDATWGGKTFANAAMWVGNKFMTNGARTISTAIHQDAKAISDAILENAPIQIQKADGWIGSLASKGGSKSLACLDFEGTYDREPIMSYLRNFRSAAPNLRCGYYPFFPLHKKYQHDGNRDTFILQSAAMKTWINSAKSYTRPILPLIDYLAPDMYLIGDKVFHRDLMYMQGVSKMLSSYDKPVFPFVWGIWHPGGDRDGDGIPDWNPPVCANDHSKPWKSAADGEWYFHRPSAEQYDLFVRTLMENFSGCIVWGPWNDNADLVEALVRAGAI